MVKSFFPHSFVNSIVTNENYPPQADNQGEIAGFGDMIYNVTEEQMLFNNTAEVMEYN